MTTAATGIRVADLSHNAPTPFQIAPDAAERSAIAQELGVDALRKLRFEGVIRARDKHDWELTGTLGFTVVQPCVVTLEPVTTRIDTRIDRVFLSRFDTPDDEEVEMPEDDNTEPLGATIDPATVMLEAVAIHMPSYPRKDGAELGNIAYTEPGQKPMTDEDARPFAGLAGLISPANTPESDGE